MSHLVMLKESKGDAFKECPGKSEEKSFVFVDQCRPSGEGNI